MYVCMYVCVSIPITEQQQQKKVEEEEEVRLYLSSDGNNILLRDYALQWTNINIKKHTHTQEGANVYARGSVREREYAYEERVCVYVRVCVCVCMCKFCS